MSISWGFQPYFSLFSTLSSLALSPQSCFKFILSIAVNRSAISALRNGFLILKWIFILSSFYWLTFLYTGQQNNFFCEKNWSDGNTNRKIVNLWVRPLKVSSVLVASVKYEVTCLSSWSNFFSTCCFCSSFLLFQDSLLFSSKILSYIFRLIISVNTKC